MIKITNTLAAFALAGSAALFTGCAAEEASSSTTPTNTTPAGTGADANAALVTVAVELPAMT